jgi:hypothetical protein
VRLASRIAPNPRLQRTPSAPLSRQPLGAAVNCPANRPQRIGHAALLALACTAVAIGQTPSPQAASSHSRPDESAISVKGPVVVAFFPPVTQKQIDSEEGVSEGISHLRYALSDTVKCLKLAGVPVKARLVFSHSILVTQDGKSQRFELPSGGQGSVGAYLFLPGKPPRRVIGESGPSSLAFFLPEAAAEFFGAAACQRLDEKE